MTIQHPSSLKSHSRVIPYLPSFVLLLLSVVVLPVETSSQEPVAWGPELEFHTFSIVAIDPRTGESGVAVTTRRPCVGNAVPWVRPGIGARGHLDAQGFGLGRRRGFRVRNGCQREQSEKDALKLPCRHPTLLQIALWDGQPYTNRGCASPRGAGMLRAPDLG